MTFSLTIHKSWHSAQWHIDCFVQCHLFWMLFTLSVANKPFMLNVVMLNVVMLCAVMLIVVAPFITQEILTCLHSNATFISTKGLNKLTLTFWIECLLIAESGNTNLRERLSTIDLLIKVACFLTRVITFLNIKQNDMNELVQGGQPYWAFPFSKTSLVECTLNKERI